jgi:hypothetical protein
VEGWLGTYAKGVRSRRERGASGLTADWRYGVGTTEYMRSTGGYALTLECGQHDDPASPEVAYRAIRNTLAHLRLVDAPGARARGALRGPAHRGGRRSPCMPEDAFARTWASFDRVKKGEVIARRRTGTELTAGRTAGSSSPTPARSPGSRVGSTSRGRWNRCEARGLSGRRGRHADRGDDRREVREQPVGHRIARAGDPTAPK